MYRRYAAGGETDTYPPAKRKWKSDWTCQNIESPQMPNGSASTVAPLGT